MSTNHTPNYQLCQWERTDKVLMEDFNGDNAKIDAAIKGVDSAKADRSALEALTRTVETKADKSALSSLSSTVSGHTGALARKGNCQILSKSYTGTGASGTPAAATTISFPGKPLFVIIHNDQAMILAGYGMRTIHYRVGTASQALVASWSGNTLSFYGNDPYVQMNAERSTYSVVAFLAADA